MFFILSALLIVPGVTRMNAPHGQGVLKEVSQAAFSEAKLRIESVSADCIRDSCGSELADCSSDPECMNVAECFSNHLQDGTATNDCTDHLNKLDDKENGMLHCARNNRCIKEKAAVTPSFLEEGSHAPASLAEKLSLHSESPDVKKAEAAWEASRKNTDQLLSRVHQEMAKLNEDLEKTSKEQKHDLALLQESRKKEDKQLEETEKKLQEMTQRTLRKTDASSFLEADQKKSDDAIFAPLRQAAEAARKFAAEIKEHASQFNVFGKKNMKESSFLEEKSSADEFGKRISINTEKADKSLSLAQEALNKLNADLSAQQKQLQEEQERLRHEKPTAVNGMPDFTAIGSPAASFLETGASSFDMTSTDAKDPLSPEALQEWKEKFEAKLRKAREISRQGLPESEQSSFAQLDSKSEAWPPASYTEASEAINRGKRDVEKMQRDFEEGLQKLKEKNASLLAQSRAQLEKDRALQADLEAKRARMHESSFLEKSNMPVFDPKKEEEHIRDLERKWKREAAKIAEGAETKLNQMDSEQNSLIEQAKEKQEQQQAQMDQIKNKLSADLEKLHKDVAAAQARAAERKKSFAAASAQAEE